MRRRLAIATGRLLQGLSRRLGRGGAALPGLVVDVLDPGFLPDVSARLAHGVIIVSGTNGKTMTTRVITDLLAAAGARPLTNRTGSNYTRGVVSAMIEVVDRDGCVPHDIAVLELDEAHAARFVARVRPRVSVLLNVSRDQLDRFGELDHTADLLAGIARATTQTVVLNRDDRLIRRIADGVPPGVDVRYFSVDRSLLEVFPGDDLLGGGVEREPARSAPAIADVEVSSLPSPRRAVVRIDGRDHPIALAFAGAYNVLNAAAALAAVRVARPDAPLANLLPALPEVEPAPGRGDRLLHRGEPIEFVLVKNPVGFRLALARSDDPDDRTATMIAVNDRYADGRDVSWLWDVDFTPLRGTGVACVTGTRAHDLALRLQYDEVPVASIGTDLAGSLAAFVADNAGAPKRVYGTYTAMTSLHAIIDRHADAE